MSQNSALSRCLTIACRPSMALLPNRVMPGTALATDSAPRPETTGTTSINRTTRTRERAALLGVGRPISQHGRLEKSQFRGLLSALQQLAGHHYALDLVGA